MNRNAKIFVTGCTGFIGSKLVEKLIAQGFFVRGLARKPPKSRLGIEYVLGDITDIESLRRGMEGCRSVFHLSGCTKNWTPDPREYDRINIEGTRNVFSAAKQHGVDRIVWTSTIVTLGPTQSGMIGNEEMPRITEKFFTDYERSKTEMERESARWVKEGLPLVIVNPTRVYGPGLLSESNTVSQLIDMHRNGMVPILFNFGRNVGNYGFVDDVVDGHIAAWKRGRIGERYILGGENVSLKEFFQAIDRIDGQKRFQLPIFWLVPMAIAYLLQWQAQLFGAYPKFTPGWLKTFLADWSFSCDKAKRELDYRPISFEEGVRRTCQWLDALKSNLKSGSDEVQTTPRYYEKDNSPDLDSAVDSIDLRRFRPSGSAVNDIGTEEGSSETGTRPAKTG